MPSVLVVQNDRPILSVLRWALVAAGFQMFTASTLDEVERCLRHQKPAALVMNIDLPRQIKEPFFEFWLSRRPALKIADLIERDEEGPSHQAHIYAELPFEIEAFARELYAAVVPDLEAGLVT